MEPDEPIYKGYLLLPSSGKILKKTWQKKYCVLYKRSSSGVARLEIFENEGRPGQLKIITLEDVIKITPKLLNINVVTKTFDMEFGTLSDDNLNNWFEALKFVAFPEESSWSNGIEQDNDLYCSSDEGVFLVKLHPSDVSVRCNLASKNYILVVTATALQLRSNIDNKLLYVWPFSYIRKYGYKGGKFTFEAGRKCASGQGVFLFEHPNHNEIYRCLAMKMKNMKKLLKGESTSSLIDCGDMQLQAALSMEAGSRNPLPLSSENSFKECSQASFGFHSQTETIANVKTVPKKPPRKVVPPKNITLSLTPVVTINSKRDYVDVSSNQSIDRYDTVETRTDAWKTLGLKEPIHSELRVSSPEENNYNSWGGSLRKAASELKLNEDDFSPVVIPERSGGPGSVEYEYLQQFMVSYKKGNSLINKSTENLSCTEQFPTSMPNKLTKSISEIKLTEKNQAPTVISESFLPTDDDYDHLNFFGQSSGVLPNSDYKQFISPGPPAPAKVNLNLYEEINVIESARSADDSHLGYARIKKDVATGALKEIDKKQPLSEELTDVPQRVDYQFQSHPVYAIISKPKRV